MFSTSEFYSYCRVHDVDVIPFDRLPVALRKESVDRNECDWKLVDGVPCRSPQGERGMFLFLTVQGGFVHADIRFNFKNCYSKKLSHKII